MRARDDPDKAQMVEMVLGQLKSMYPIYKNNAAKGVKD